MSALYKMIYAGGTGDGFGVVALSKGKVLGADVGDFRYDGSYVESGDRVKLTATMTASANGGVLVTGMAVPPGQKLQLAADWPASFADGAEQTILVAGSPVKVRFEKIGDLP